MMNKSKMLTIVIGAATAGLLITTAAEAKGHRDGGPKRDLPSFAELDADGDGMLSVAEMLARAEARFALVDSNGDGVITADESIQAAQDRAAEQAGERFARLLEWRDSDGDGGLSPAEIGDNRAEQMFLRADADGDGLISAEEFEQARERGPRGRRDGKSRDGDRDTRQGG